MQLPLSFEPPPPSPSEPSPKVWTTLDSHQRNETLALLARLLVKTATASPGAVSTLPRKEHRND